MQKVEAGLLGPVCILCTQAKGRAVQVPKMELVENLPGDGKDWCKVLMKCHGQEELVKFEMGTAQWDYEELRKLVNKRNWFDPKVMAGLTEEI